jgi:hypothetical protein
VNPNLLHARPRVNKALHKANLWIRRKKRTVVVSDSLAAAGNIFQLENALFVLSINATGLNSFANKIEEVFLKVQSTKNFADLRVALVFRIWKVLGSKCYPPSVSLSSSEKMLRRNLKLGHKRSFHVLSNSFFMYHTIIRRYILY